MPTYTTAKTPTVTPAMIRPFFLSVFFFATAALFLRFFRPFFFFGAFVLTCGFSSSSRLIYKVSSSS